MSGNIGIIGLGRLGMSLCRALSESGQEPAAVYSRTYRNEFEGFNYDSDIHSAVGKSDIVFMCMNDDSIQPAAQRISDMFSCLPGKMFVHFSGLLSSRVLEPLARKGAKTASFHPVQTFPTTASQLNFRNIYYAFEGDDILGCLEEIFKSFDPVIVRIEAEKKPVYHAAAVMSSNLLCALLGISDRLLTSIDMKEGVFLHKELVYAIVKNIFEKGVANALTGPAARGDLQSVAQHLSALKGNEREIYRLLSEEAVRIGREAGLADAERYELLEKMLIDSKDTE